MQAFNARLTQRRLTLYCQLVHLKVMTMKKMVLFAVASLLVFTIAGNAQTALAPDQNPNYMVSQNRYLKMADSINSWHGTTPQETYKAIDYLEDKREARANRQQWRRELRMERARNGGWYYNGGYNGYYPSYGYNNSYYYGNAGNSWGYRRNRSSNYLWGAAPLALTLGYYWWR
jgi:hypothetical protein